MLDHLLKSPKLASWQQLLQKGSSVITEGLWDAPKSLLIALAQKATNKHVLILTGGGPEESRLYHDFPLFTNCTVDEYPAWETLPTEKIAPSPDIVGERYQLLRKVTSQENRSIILSSLNACLLRLIPPTAFQKLSMTLKVGDSISFTLLIEQLQAMGYTRRPVASDKGEFAVRGGIVDLFPVSSPDPYRFEFWGDVIESMRIYDPVGQKSVRPATEIEITPAQELELLSRSETQATLLDYLGPNTLIVFDDLLTLEDRYASLIAITGHSPHTLSIDEFFQLTDKMQKIYFSSAPIDTLGDVQTHKKKRENFYSAHASTQPITLEMFNRKLHAERYMHPFAEIARYLKPEVTDEETVSGEELLVALSELPADKTNLYFLCSSDAEENSLKEKIKEHSISLPLNCSFQRGYLSSGFALWDSNTVVFPHTEITHRYRLRRQKQRSTYHTAPIEVYDLNAGEAVVHLNHGIGRYIGLEKRHNNNDIETEFFHIEYADSAKLFVPINQAHLITKYIGSKEESPKLHTLGSNRWKKAKESTERAIMGYAAELLEVYAKRTVHGGFSYPEDSDEMRSFEDEFPFVETEDQVRAIADIKEDLKSSKPMDRLVCGDVGYGKTEVAMRAAFKAVLDGRKQVAVLVPTTVLALQHYENFVERMKDFPVNIHVLSRFRSAKETQETIRGIANGSVDIVIGTHRIVSQDIHFKELGLIIIDEEQRFGVKAKEHLKRIKTAVDCLTLSATPIPRTLYMSLVGVRDMSVINTPPQDRLPIKTIISEASDEILKNALLRELTRDGQAYVIHNRVETIYEYAAHIQKLLPQARIVVGHGQMGADELDMVFHAFKRGTANILIATTIIENGIDIPNANTILIDRADRFGLADLYQLRGRVGRWNRRSYAYFLVPKWRTSSEIVRKRLEALAGASGYGGGMKVAMRDLEIRGAGDILGTEQSGHVSAIGFHLYCKLLKRTIDAMKGKIPSTLVETKIEFPFDARLPEDYVNEQSLRMEFYQRLGEALSWEDVDQIWGEVKDRFGPPPEPALWLYYMTRVRVWASRKGIISLKLEGPILVVEQHKGKKVEVVRCAVGRILTPKDLEKIILVK